MDEKSIIMRVGPENAQELAQLHGSSFTKAWDERSMLSLLQNAPCQGFGAYSCATLVAFVLFNLVLDEAEILTIATHPAERGKGHARRLLTLAIEELSGQGAEKFFLDVADNNAPAVKLYLTCGFRPYGRRPGYYEGIDALLLRRDTQEQEGRA